MDIKLMPEQYKRRRGISAERPGADLVSQLTPKTNLWLFSAIGFLVLTILVCGGLWFYKSNLDEEKVTLEERLIELNSQRNLELENNFMEFKERMDKFKQSLENRLYSSKIFETLEELTLPQIWFTDLTAELLEAELELSAQAINYQTLAKQVVAFEEDERIESVEFSEAELDTSGQINSELKIKLRADFLKTD